MNGRTSAAASTLLAALMTVSLAVRPASVSAAEQDSLTAYANEVVTLVNEERAIYGLAPLKASASLHEAAQLRAKETVKNFSHTRPDGRGSATVLNDMGIGWRSCGENIAYGYKDAEAVMDGWMHSDGHRANILSTSYEYIGVGVAERGGVIYCTQIFTGGVDPDTAEAPSQPDVTLPEDSVTTEIPDVTVPCIGESCSETNPSQSDSDTHVFCIGGICLNGTTQSCPTGNLLQNLLCKLTGRC